MTRNQKISENAQYSGRLMAVYITFSLGSQTGLLPLFIKRIVLFSYFLFSVKLFCNPFRSYYSVENYVGRAFLDSEFCKKTMSFMI